MKLWISAKDAPPDFDWDWVTTTEAAKAMLKMFTKMSLEEDFEAIAYGDMAGDDSCESMPGWLRDCGIEFKEVRVTSFDVAEIRRILDAIG